MSTPPSNGLAATSGVLDEVWHERARQHARWGERNHPAGTGGPTATAIAAERQRLCQQAFQAGRGTWRHVLAEEVAEAFAETDPAALRWELVQVAAVAVAWIEAIDRHTRTEGHRS